MPIDLEHPLSLQNAEPAFLEELQGNILKGHGRENTINMFLTFDPGAKDEAKAFIRDVGQKVTSSQKQLDDTARFQAEHVPGDVVVLCFLTASGYETLGIAAARTPNNSSFQDGLKSKRAILKDPPADVWDEHFQENIHALIIIADDTRSSVHSMRTQILAIKPNSVTVVGEEIGLAMRNVNGDGIEHFGYVDGRSQPLLLVEDIERETNTTDGTNVWSPAFPLKQALVACPGGTVGTSFGSYFVFRKLEQDVLGFKTLESEIALQLDPLGQNPELAGAMIVGRFEDGTPVVLQQSEGAHSPVMNNFNYESDKEGLKCPFHGHIRKTNPRGESVGTFAPDVETERSHIMARRGITYGNRIWENDMVNSTLDEDHLPSKDVGLLFMAYQSDLGEQFEFTQMNWANNEGFVKPGAGIDPVMGQGTPTVQLEQTRKWGEAGKDSFDFGGFVTMKGGEYFFAPCISFLKTI